MNKDQMLNYKGYYGSINLDTDNHVLYGKVEFIRALITFEAEDAPGLLKSFHEAIDDYLILCKEKNIDTKH